MLRGFLWEGYDGEQIFISQSFWRGHVQLPKTKHSKAPVPVINQLAVRFDQHRVLTGNPESGLMFPGTGNRPVNLDALVVEVIRPSTEKRRPPLVRLACVSPRLGNNPPSTWRTGQNDPSNSASLNVAVTQGCYIKTVSNDVVAAMRSLEYAPIMHLESAAKSRIM